MKILLTGAEGFIGSHLVEKLVKKGHKVTALVLYNSFNDIGNLNFVEKKTLNKIKIIFGDIRDSDFVQKYFKSQDVIINLAALIGIPYSYIAANSYVDTNVKGLLNILDVVKKNKKCQLIQVSSSEVYGTAKYVPMNEEHPLNAQSPYAATKIAADQIALSFFRSFNCKISIIRPFNTFGPRQSLRAIIPSLISQSLNKKNVKIGNIKPTRDFTYIDDLTEAFCKMLGNSKTIGQVVNIGSNYEISIGNLSKLVIKNCKTKTKITFEKSRFRPKKSEVFRLYANNAKARKLLKWSPKNKGLKGFDMNLKKTIKWYKNFVFKDSLNVNKYHL